MKKILVAVLVVIAIMVMVVPNVVFGATTQLVSINATGSEVDISNTPDNWGFGTMAANDTAETTGGNSAGHFTVTNDGSSDVDITIQANNMVGAPVSWAINDAGTNGAAIAGLKASAESSSWDVIVRVSAPFNDIRTYLNGAASQDWGLQLEAPSSGIGNNLVSGNVTLTGSLSS